MEKEKTKKNVKKEMSKQDKTLIATFIGLIILVAVLGIVALNLDNIHKDDNQDLVIEDVGFIKITNSMKVKVYYRDSINVRVRDNLI